MNKLIGIFTVTLMMAFVAAGTAEAAVMVNNNGRNSTNRVYMTHRDRSVQDQRNRARITNRVNVGSQTGDNKANSTTKGTVDVDAGETTTTVRLDTAVNVNEDATDPCDCDTHMDPDVTIKNNGNNSRNTVRMRHMRMHRQVQTNNATVSNNVTVNSDTGGNTANGTTGGDVDVTSGDTTTTVNVVNTANTNVNGSPMN